MSKMLCYFYTFIFISNIYSGNESKAILSAYSYHSTIIPYCSRAERSVNNQNTFSPKTKVKNKNKCCFLDLFLRLIQK